MYRAGSVEYVFLTTLLMTFFLPGAGAPSGAAAAVSASGAFASGAAASASVLGGASASGAVLGGAVSDMVAQGGCGGIGSGSFVRRREIRTRMREAMKWKWQSESVPAGSWGVGAGGAMYKTRRWVTMGVKPSQGALGRKGSSH